MLTAAPADAVPTMPPPPLVVDGVPPSRASAAATAGVAGAEPQPQSAPQPVPVPVPAAAATPSHAQPAGALRSGTFDVCHAGVVLRALLAAHGLLAVGGLFAAHDLAGWVAALAAGSAQVLPAVLLWLLMSCGLKRPLAGAPRSLQLAVAAALGAVAGFGGWALGQVGGVADASGVDAASVSAWQSAACALAGAWAGVAMFQWLELRARARLPADTTARLAELQSRIRPHFLFNTLNTALGLVRLDPARAEGVLEDLAELFRAALADADEEAGDGRRGDGSVTLADEVELAKRYLAIEQIRFGARLCVSWDLDEAAAGARVPPLLLQPLVENAVRHGIEPADAGGSLQVQTRVTLGRVVVTIVNSLPEAQPSTPGHGIALRNVRERLRLMHDVAAQLELRREPREFRVRIVLPL